MKDFLSSIVLYNFQKFYTHVFIESYNNSFFPCLSIVSSSFFPLLACSLYMIQIKNVGKDVEKREPSYTMVENENWCSMAVSQKSKKRTTL